MITEDNKLIKIKTSELSHTLYIKGVELASAEKDYSERDLNRKSLLAALIEELRGEDKSISRAKADDLSRCNDIYKQYCLDISECRSKLFIARAKYAAVDAEIKIRLSKSYRDNREMNSGKTNT